MALSHSKVKKQSEIRIDRKEDDPNRIHMTKAQAVAANKLLREGKAELISFQEEQRRKREAKMEEIIGKKIEQKHGNKVAGFPVQADTVQDDDDDDDSPENPDPADQPTGLQHGKKGKKGK